TGSSRLDCRNSQSSPARSAVDCCPAKAAMGSVWRHRTDRKSPDTLPSIRKAKLRFSSPSQLLLGDLGMLDTQPVDGLGEVIVDGATDVALGFEGMQGVL